jgi:hypothetical protein
MRQRVGLVVLSSVLLSSLAAAPPPRREPAPKREAQPQPRPLLVITEIMYDPQSGETEDVQTEWVEILNRSAQAANLKGLQITSGAKGKIHDAKQRFVLPDVTIGAGEHVVIGMGASSCYGEFKLPSFAAYCGETKYAWLANTGDSVAIRDANGIIIDEVVYEIEPPWPAANRAGGSIQFIAPDGENPSVANDEAKNWVACNANNSDEFEGHGRGTPGAPAKDGGATTQPVVAKKK